MPPAEDAPRVATWTVDDAAAGTRLDAAIAKALPELSRSRATALIREAMVTVDGEVAKPSTKVRAGEEIEVEIPAPEPIEAVAQDIPLDILYEDADLIVVNKEAGMVVHPAAGNPDGTLVNALLGHVRDLSGVGGAMRPGIVHRLDKGTSGAIVCAKNDKAHESLSNQFAARTVEKRYLAFTLGVPAESQALIDEPIARDPKDRKRMAVVEGGRESRTRYRALASRDGIAAVECDLLTGRTHQIRVHLRHLGHPLLMDDLYSGVRGLKNLTPDARALAESLTRPALHAWKLSFRHPRTDEKLEFVAPIAKDLQPLVEFLGLTL
ncbi:MAG: RluA family pseudouridine synthase [Deltaproteobacteria bacterium]|nr:RluA family pseudouridine synthase [Deltaproteobacteria bacterium]